MFLNLHHLIVAKYKLLTTEEATPKGVKKINEVSEVYMMSAESTQTLCEVQSQRNG